MKKIIAFVVAFSPVMAFAQTGSLSKINNINDVSNKITGIANTITYLLVALAVIYIVWNVVMYIIRPSGSEGKSEAGIGILWGIVGLFIIVSIWGLVNILTNTFATTPTNYSIPNAGNVTGNGGLPANQNPVSVP